MLGVTVVVENVEDRDVVVVAAVTVVILIVVVVTPVLLILVLVVSDTPMVVVTVVVDAAAVVVVDKLPGGLAVASHSKPLSVTASFEMNVINISVEFSEETKK